MSHRSLPAATTSRRWLHSPWLRPFNDPVAINSLLQMVRPSFDLGAVRARVAGIIDETADTRSFVLDCNRHWRGFRAGQHVLVTLTVRGRRLQRCFSISSAPSRQRRIEITVKRQSENGVTAWMHGTLKVGSIVTLSQAGGGFSLPQPLPDRILLVAAGSGITPLMSMLRDLHARQHRGEVILFYCSRSPAGMIFGSELRQMESSWPTLRVFRHFTAELGRPQPGHLLEAVPDCIRVPTYLCGPSALTTWVGQLYADAGTRSLLHSETFGLPVPAPGQDQGEATAVRCEITEHVFAARPGQPLLIAAEQAGLTPAHGCRMGICRSCQCRKRSGVVENLLTGEICAEPDQLIQLCISSARTPLILDL